MTELNTIVKLRNDIDKLKLLIKVQSILGLVIGFLIGLVVAYRW